jgi:ssDNA-binding Zn-finger/Zn-ribbon topoisomerase 1
VAYFRKGEIPMAKPALIECPTCQNRVSTTAKSCPSCGAVLRKAKRGIFGKFIIFLFWAFNILMVAWIWGAIKLTSEHSAGLSGAEAAGAAIGTGLGITMIVFVWLFGAVILGLMALLTRPK